MVIRLGLPFSRMTTKNLISAMKVAIIQILPFLNNPKDLYPSDKMDLDFGIVLKGKQLSYNRRYTVIVKQ